MSNNPNNNEIFMPENKSNKASIIVAIVAICLILGGVYLINQGVNSSNKTKETAQNTNSNSSSSSTPTTSTSTKATTSTTEPTETTTPTTNTAATTTPTTVDTTTPATTTTPSTSSTTTPTTTPTTTTPEPAKLENNQIVAKALSVSDSGETRFEIKECGIPNATVCKAGTKFTLTGVKSSVDKTYLVSGNITESNGALSLENIIVKEYTAS